MFSRLTSDHLHRHSNDDVSVDGGVFDHFEDDQHQDTDDTIGDGIHNLNNMLLWGTDISVSKSMNIFSNFLRSFQPDEESGQSFYERELLVMHRSGNTLLNLNCQHVKEFPSSRQFYAQMIQVIWKSDYYL